MNIDLLGVTPSQTIGPFFKFGTEWIADEDVVSSDHPNSFVLTGTAYDGAGDPVCDAMLEIFQADEQGKFPTESKAHWSGFARRLTDDNGSYQIRTVKPGAVATSYGEMQAPHIVMVLFARGLLKPVFTRIYFPDEAEANSSDPVLKALTSDDARSTMLAVKKADGTFEFDIRLQDSSRGPETQFIQFGI